MHKSANASADTYINLREQARGLVLPAFASIAPQGLELSDLTDEALRQANQWGGFAWGYIAGKFRRRPRRVELAIWHNGILCGIAVGRVSNRRVIASIHFLEGSPRAHPLKGLIAPIATRFLDTFGILAECSETSIQNPVEPLIPMYKQLGYVKEVSKGPKVVRLHKKLGQ